MCPLWKKCNNNLFMIFNEYATGKTALALMFTNRTLSSTDSIASWQNQKTLRRHSFLQVSLNMEINHLSEIQIYCQLVFGGLWILGSADNLGVIEMMSF